MKSKLRVIVLAASAAFFSFIVAGCASTQQASSIQDRIAAACPVVQVAMAGVQALSSPDLAQLKADADKAAPVVAQICAGNASVDTSSVQALVSTSFPALIADVNATSLAPEVKARAIAGLTLAQIAFTAAVQLAPQPTASVAPASQ